MPIPAALIGVMAGASAVNLGANLYSQYKQRQLYRYQKGGYERQLADWEKNVGKGRRSIRYPELSYPGRIRALDTGISQSYASSLGSYSRTAGQLAGLGRFGTGSASRSLYSRSAGRTSRYL